MNDRHDASKEFSLERQRRAGRASAREKGEQESIATGPNKPSSAEVTDSAFPDRIRRKYYVVASDSKKDGSGRQARLYADERKEYLAFKTTDDRLVTRIAAAEVVRDMVSVAQHRQWEALYVRGSVEFRREAWLEAGARGIEVQGYQANELDRQVLADRRAVWDRAHARTNGLEARSASDRSLQADTLDHDKGVSGRLMEVGFGPYRNRPDAEPSTYVAIELDDGRRHQVWGVGVVTDVADSGARPGDRISLRKDGVAPIVRAIKVIDDATGIAGTERRQMWRNMWNVTVEERRADRPAAGHDSDLLAAQSQIVVIKKLVERALPNDENARQSIMAFAKERVARHLENGRSFSRATVLNPVRERHLPRTHKDEARHGGRLRAKEQEP
ncbi:LPD7 domain-containing protein [Bradyrhizobium sp. USDA 3458]|uniref:LPD7 domain-containing protein n=1 Tax=Bradyrhizobium sp. USDA 3458 TaxID=2591461 RepID=UPI00132F5C4C|nr:LPD7 domain-containing protein [Bradyrhizobium sp. USDA 3458]